MAAHAYWRVRCTDTVDHGEWWVDELVFRDAGGVDVTTGGTGTASSEASSLYQVAYAFDKSIANNGWSSVNGPGTHWLGYAFPAPVDIVTVDITVPNTGAPLDDQTTAGSLFIEFSDDGVAWTLYGRLMPVSGTFGTMGSVVACSILLIPSVNTFKIGNPIVRVPDPQAPSQQVGPTRLVGEGDLVRFDSLDAGPYKVVGYTKQKALPTNINVYRKVWLVDQFSGRIVRDAWSDPVTGYYEFLNIRMGKFMVIGFDHTLAQNGTIATNVPLELM